jgi:hypothetical protein
VSGPGLYVYAIAFPGVSPDALGTGIDGAAVTLVTEGEVAAVVHEHPGGPYEGSDDDARRWVLKHSEVIDRVWESTGTVLPVSFNVIVAGEHDAPADQRLRGWLRGNAAALNDRLRALTDHVELRVEITLDQEAVTSTSTDVAALREEMEDRPPGVRRLLSKKLEKLKHDITDRLADEVYEDYRRRLAALSEDLTENRNARPKSGTVAVLAASLLLPREHIERIGMELTQIQDEQPASRIRFLGPWPPYSFADLPQLADAAG